MSRAADLTRPGASKPLILEWRDECDSLEQGGQGGRFATQPSLGPYDSISKVYSFVSPFHAADGKVVSTLEQYGTDHPEASINAHVEMLTNDKWISVRSFKAAKPRQSCSSRRTSTSRIAPPPIFISRRTT